jgi:hypothetical protein
MSTYFDIIPEDILNIILCKLNKMGISRDICKVSNSIWLLGQKIIKNIKHGTINPSEYLFTSFKYNYEYNSKYEYNICINNKEKISNNEVNKFLLEFNKNIKKNIIDIYYYNHQKKYKNSLYEIILADHFYIYIILKFKTFKQEYLNFDNKEYQYLYFIDNGDNSIRYINININSHWHFLWNMYVSNYDIRNIIKNNF